MHASAPYSLLPHASWATPRLGPMIRMAGTLYTHAVRRGPGGVGARQLAVRRR